MLSLILFYNGWAAFVLRLVVGLIFFGHGTPKIRNLKENANNFTAMGFRPGVLWGGIAAFVEFFGGIWLIIGSSVRATAFVLAIEVAVIIVWRLIKKHKFVGGWEFELLLFVALVALFALGAGVYSVDRLFPVGY